jgi:predicted NBD/HSP70 family sugar kinase
VDYSQNERFVLQCLRRRPGLSRAEIARLSGQSAQTISVVTNRLLRDGLVLEREKRYGSVGKPATQLQLNPQGAYSLGIKLGRKDIVIALVDFTGVIIDRVLLQELTNPQEDLQLVIQQSNRLFQQNPGSAFRLAGIGVAAPYRLESWHEELRLDTETSARLAEWADVNIAETLYSHFGCEVFLENDGTAATMAEMLFGVGQKTQDFVYVFLDVVIGGGIVCNGDIWRGPHGNAGDLALMRLGEPGKASLLLEHASLYQLLNELQRAGIEKPRIAGLERIDGPERKLFEQWVNRAARALGLLAFNMHSLLDTQAIVLASRLPPEPMRFFTQAMEEALHLEHQLDPGQSRPRILEGHLRTDVHALGAAMVPYYHRYAPTPSLLQGRDS